MRIVLAETRHIGRIARHMREIDARECAGMGRDPKGALRIALAQSSKAWTALVDDRPEAMFGVIVQSVLGREGAPWFLGTDEVYRHGRELVMWGPGIISVLSDNSKLRLANLVSAENSRAIRLLGKWGFDVADATEHYNDVPFRRFAKEPC